MNARGGRDGQVLVIFAAGLITLLAIAALVIDLGFVFMIRRQEQNAADPAAIAAARYIRHGGVANPTAMRQAACEYVRLNGYFRSAADNDGCTPANDENGASLIVNYPPSFQAGRFAGDPCCVEVVLTRQHRSFLAALVGRPTIGVSSAAVAAFGDGNSNTSSLIALDPGNACAAARTHGTGDILIHPAPGVTTGGYVHVNSTCGSSPDTACMNDSNAALVLGGTSTLTAPHTYTTGTCKSNGNSLFGPLTEGATQIGDPLLELKPPRIADYPAGRCSATSPPLTPGSGGCVFNDAGVTHIEPGVYYGGWDIKKNGAVLELGPGVYILAGGGIKLSNQGSITSVQGASGMPAPVFIFNTDDPLPSGARQANIDFNAQATLKLRAIDHGPYKGILLWNDGNGSNPGALIDLKGQSNLDLSGTIYSPKGLVNMEGGSSGTSVASVQIISWHWDVGGNANLDMPYDPAGLYQFKNKGLVH